MLLENAIKKLNKVGKVEVVGSLYFAKTNGNIIEFMRNGREEDNCHITCIRVRNERDKDDTMTDYFAGVWCDNLTQAIRLATKI